MPGAGRYHISRKIADGGMAEIFLGRQRGVEGFERPVVLKRILASLLADPQFRNQMIDEAHVAMSLNHSNIVQVLDLGHARGRYFLVLELVDGWDLNQIFNRARAASFPLPPELSLYVAGEVCRALGYAHAKTRDGQPLGIVHRDVSPHNVLVSEQGEVKLTDFGIAKATGRREHTGHGVIKGKLAFMSPEQASGSAVDARSDIFSLGTVLYLLGTGRRPFEAPTDLEAIVRVRQCQFARPEEVTPDISPEFARITLRAMQAAPANRYQSAEEMLVDIETVQRSAFKAAGQTELKRWLAELQQMDGAPTISKAIGQPPATDDSEPLQLDGSEDLIFDDSSQVSELREGPVRPTMPTMAATPALLPTMHVAAPPPTPPAKDPSKLSRRVAMFFFLGGAATLLAWLGLRDTPRRQHIAARSSSAPRAPASPVPAPAEPPSPQPTEEPAKNDQPPAPEETRPPPQPPPTEDEEEALLKHSEPASSDQILGEAEGEVPAKPPGARHGERAKSERALPESVSVHIESRPQGAVVKLKERVFGRSPLNLRFRPGITYQLTFVKKGYETVSRRFTVSGRKNQKVIIALKKKPAPKKSFFRRILGR
ncbi:MAG: serine/threonine-protein kinase [Polyangia bacterium]|jgi:serine/threonine-protein kinase